jgi:hypothetical protein
MLFISQATTPEYIWFKVIVGFVVLNGIRGGSSRRVAHYARIDVMGKRTVDRQYASCKGRK